MKTGDKPAAKHPLRQSVKCGRIILVNLVQTMNAIRNNGYYYFYFTRLPGRVGMP